MMHPILIKLDGIVIYSYGLMVALGLAIGLWVVTTLGKKNNIEPKILVDVAFYTIIVAILGSRIGFVLLNPSYYLKYPIEILKFWEGGLVFSFGFASGFIVLLFLTRKKGIPFLHMGDLWAPGLALGQAIGRIGCFLAGCCHGRETDSWCSVTFTHPNSLAPLNIPLYPTQLFHSFANFLIFVVLMLLWRHRRYRGQILAWYMILHSTQRLIIERFRGDFRGYFLGTELTTTQALSLLILIGGVILLWVLRASASKGKA